MTASELIVLRYDDGIGNFGDDLNEYLWPALLPDTPIRFVPNDATDPFDHDDLVLVGIGTILNQRIPALPHKMVLGAGVGYLEPPVVDDSYSMLAVRGPLTAERLGLDPSLAATDAAALLADVLVPDPGPGQARIGLMPHHRTMDCLRWPEVCSAARVTLLDPRQDPVSTINQIRSCSLVLAEAMHGAIVADLYGIPWIPIRLSHRILDFKWRDWCASIGLDYEPAVGPLLRPSPSWKGHLANRSARNRVVRFLRATPRSQALLSDRRILGRRTDRLRSGLDAVRDRLA